MSSDNAYLLEISHVTCFGLVRFSTLQVFQRTSAFCNYGCCVNHWITSIPLYISFSVTCRIVSVDFNRFSQIDLFFQINMSSLYSRKLSEELLSSASNATGGFSISLDSRNTGIRIIQKMHSRVDLKMLLVVEWLRISVCLLSSIGIQLTFT